MENPGTRIVSLEPDRRVISCKANANDVPLDGIYIIIDSTPRTTNDRESVLGEQCKLDPFRHSNNNSLPREDE